MSSMQKVPALEVLTGDPHRLEERASGQLDGRREPEELVGGGAVERRVRPPLRLGVGVAGEGEDRAGQQVDRRLVACDEEQDRRRQELHVVQAVLPVVRGDERGEQVVGRVTAALLEQTVEVEGELRERLVARDLQRLGQQELGVEPARERGGAVLELVAVLARHAEQLADDRDGQRPGEVVHGVEGAPPDRGVEQRVGLGLDEAR